MTKRDTGHEDDDDDDHVLREGESLHVPMSLMDAFRRHPMHTQIRDACDARAAAAERVKAFDENVERIYNGWRGSGTADRIPVADKSSDPRAAAYADYCNFIMNGWRHGR